MKEYKATRVAGKLCYFTCGKFSRLPIRDFLNEQHSGFKKEPSYETASYNYFKSCNNRSLVSAINRGVSHILFVTRYQGQIADYQGRYFITGFYEIGLVGENFERRIYIEASKMAFTEIQNAFEVTADMWKKICPTTSRSELRNLRWCTQVVKGPLLSEILFQLNDHNVVNDYIKQLKRDW